jgi:hypothetical protein
MTDAAASTNPSLAGFLMTFVAGRQVGDPLADGLHHAGHVRTPYRDLRPAQADSQAQDGRLSRDCGPVRRVDAGRPHADQHVVGTDHWHLDLLAPEHVLRRPVTALADSPHDGRIGWHRASSLRLVLTP